MEENIYEKVVTNEDQQDEPITEADEYSYYTNECYELQQPYQQQNNTSNGQDHVINFQSSSRESGGEGEQSGYKKGDSHIILKIKKCLIALSCAVVFLSLVVIAMVTLGVVYYLNSSRELTNEVSVLNSQLNQMTQESVTRLTNKDDIISEQIVQLQNMTIKLEGRLINEDSYLSNQLDQLQNVTIELERTLTSKDSSLSNQLDYLQNMTMQLEEQLTNKENSLNNQLDQINNKTQEIERELSTDINTLKLQQNQSVSSTQDNISQVVKNLNTVKNTISSLQEQIYCGAGQWNRVAFLNMSDTSQQCPSAWRLVTTNGVRACGRPVSSWSSCPGTYFSTVNEYSRVCGRVIGYQNNSADGFHLSPDNVSNVYMDGVSITVTYGGTRSHIWSYVAGVTERSSLHTLNNCPCSPAAGTGPPSFVSDNYYCESGNPTDSYRSFYSADKLWDGKQCEGTCCSGSKSPPWFSVHLPNSTTGSIEVRICSNESTDNEDSPIELLEIYVQ